MRPQMAITKVTLIPVSQNLLKGACRILIMASAMVAFTSCSSYSNLNPNNSGNGWIVKKSLFSDSLMYCFAPSQRTDKPVCIDAIDAQTIPGDGLDAFLNPKKGK